jgi:hypothetical protein
MISIAPMGAGKTRVDCADMESRIAENGYLSSSLNMKQVTKLDAHKYLCKHYIEQITI